MTVAELKEILTEFPEEAKVVVLQQDGTKVDASGVNINRDYEVSIS